MKSNFQKRPKKSSLIIGREAVEEALAGGQAIDRVYLDGKLRPSETEKVRQLATINAIPINYVPQVKLDSFNIPNHQGFVAQISKVHYYELQDIISQVIERGEVPLFLMLDGITDIRNIGGIARTAFCTGVNAIIIPSKGVGALNEDAIQTSAGALEKIPICRVPSLMKAVDELHANGVQVFASEMTAKKKIGDCDFTIPVTIIMGSEEKGIYPALKKIADEVFSIPMKGGFESLNVSVATGMILYEIMRQRD